MKTSSLKKDVSKPLDRGILLGLLFLIGVGLVQVYSSSFIFAIENFKGGHFFFFKQFLFSVLGLSSLLVFAKLKWKYAKALGFVILGLSVLGIIATFVPSFSIQAGGANRWVKLPMGLRFEPSEFLKISFPMLLGWLMVRKANFINEKADPFVRLSFVLIPFMLLHKQPDFGSIALLSMMIVSVLFVYGLRWKYLFASAVMALPAFYFLVLKVPYRRARIQAFLDPWADPAQSGFQVIQSLLSFQSGGVWGAGLGQGQGKLFFLPEAHTDFTLAVLGEEMGLVGFLVVLAVYGYLVFRGLQISSQVEQDFPKIVALGFTVLFGYQVFINMGVVLGILPTKGLTLPFLSYGGSSLLATCIGFGWLLNIERNFCKKRPVKIGRAKVIRNPNW